MNPGSYFLPCWHLISCKPHHLVLIVYSRVSQPVGHGRICEGLQPGNIEIEHIWQVEPFINENEQRKGSAFALIVAKVLSLKVVLISALCMRNGCGSGEILQSMGSGDSRMKKLGGSLRGQGKSRGGSKDIYLAWW